MYAIFGDINKPEYFQWLNDVSFMERTDWFCHYASGWWMGHWYYL